MNRDDIIRMAREAGFDIDIFSMKGRDCFERFAALVAAAEREACADLLEHGCLDDDKHHIQYAAAIRARGEA